MRLCDLILLLPRAAPSPLGAGGDNLLSDSCQGLNILIILLLIFCSLPAQLVWWRLSHAWVLTSWGSTKGAESDVGNWEKTAQNCWGRLCWGCFSLMQGSRNPARHLPAVVLLLQAHSLHLEPTWGISHAFIWSSFGCPRCQEHHRKHQGAHQGGQILGRFNCAEVCTVKSQPKYWLKAVLCR